MHEVICLLVPLISVMRVRPIDRRGGVISVESGELERDHRVDDEVPCTKIVKVSNGVELTVCHVRQRSGRRFTSCDETVYANVVCPNPQDDNKLLWCHVEFLMRCASTKNMVLREPSCLYGRDIVHVSSRGKGVVANCPAHCIVPDLEVPVETKVPGPLKTSVCRDISLYEN